MDFKTKVKNSNAKSIALSVFALRFNTQFFCYKQLVLSSKRIQIEAL